MKRHRHLFEQVCCWDNLLAAARAACKGKRGRAAAASFFARQEDEIVRLMEELSTGAYRPGAYHYFEIREPKVRIVAAAPFRDRVVHHAVVRVLEPIFERRFIDDSFACRKGKGTHAAMHRAHQFARRFCYALKCDVAKYFPSIDHEILKIQLARAVGDTRLLDVVRLIIGSHRDELRKEWEPGADLFGVSLRPVGLPIGNLTSQFFANVYLNDLDHFVKHDLRVKGYARYVDDFLLFGDDRSLLKQHGAAIREKLRALRLTIHPDKYRLLPTDKGVDFVGFVLYSNGRRRLRRANVRRFQRRYRRMMWEVRRGERKPSDVSTRVRCWIAHASHAQSYALRRDVLRGV